MIKKIFRLCCFRFFALIDGDTFLLKKLCLDRDDNVIDLGGYTGEWAQRVFDRYDCKIVIFEPQRTYALMCKYRFKDFSDRVIVSHAAVGKSNGVGYIQDSGIGGSVHSSYPFGEKVTITDIKEVVVSKVSLLKMNIEGGEYEVLQELIVSGKINDVDKLLIQFHDTKNNTRRELRLLLMRTHVCRFNIPYVWELWERKKIFYVLEGHHGE